MSIPLTREQRQAVLQSKEPLRLIDLDSKEEYLLLPPELYERMRQRAEAEVVDRSLYEFEDPNEETSYE